MPLHRLYHEQVVPAPIEEVFPFFARPENLARITPPSMGFRILTPEPVGMKDGALIDYTVNGLPGIPMRWTTLITSCEPPHRFVDVQLRGPYAYWHHTHRFESVEDGTRLTDEVLYMLPLGALGEIAHRLFVRRMLKTIFDYRREVIQRRFG
ncbi:CDP-paratose 2-epimerase [bacterium]|nr:CDP-paratose 2-epimerase [bacterium]